MPAPTRPAKEAAARVAVSVGDRSAPVTNRRRWAIVGLLFVASLINYFDRATISFALPLISTDLGLGPEAKGVLLSAFFWSYTLMQIPMGVFADRMNLRWLYAGAFVLWSVSQGLIGLATGLGSLIAFRVLLGVGEAIYLPGGSKIVSLLFKPAERGLPCGVFDAGTRTGLVLEGLLVPWMLTQLRLEGQLRSGGVRRPGVAGPVVRDHTRQPWRSRPPQPAPAGQAGRERS